MLVAPVVVILNAYLRHGDDLITSRHLFLLGCSKFMGVAGLTTGITQLYRGNHPVTDALWLFFAAVLFFAAFFWSYGRWNLPQRVAARRWHHSPTPNVATIMTAGGAAVFAGLLASALPVQIPIVGQIFNVLGKLLPSAGIALFLIAWLRSPVNVIYLVAAGASFALAIFVALFGAGRHPLFAALIAVPIAWYWGAWRYQRPTATLGRILALGVGAAFLILVYSGFRHDFMGEADSAVAVDRIKQLLNFELQLGGDADSFLQEDAVTVGLLCVEQYHRMGEPDYFHTLKFVLSNPIPREWWPDKPQALGEALPESLGEFVDGYVNWGPSILGNAFHDGGAWMAGIYGLVLGFILRVFDDILRRQSRNPWPVAMLAAMSPKIVAYSRGDIAVYTVELLGLLVLWLLGMKVLGMIFGRVDESEFHDPPFDDGSWNSNADSMAGELPDAA